MLIYSVNNINSTTSGTITWMSDSVWLDTEGIEYIYHYIPDEIEQIPAIQGNPDGANWLVSWAYEKKDPVAFFKSRNDMLKFISVLRKDERVIQKSIIIHKISAQYRPKEVRRLKRLWVKELRIEREIKRKDHRSAKKRNSTSS